MVQHQLGVTWQSWISHFRQAQGEGATEVGRDILLLRRYNAATAAHQPQIFAGAIDCFLCSEMHRTQVPKVESAALDGVRIHRLTGYHHTLFESPHVEYLAEQLAGAMARSQVAEETQPVA
ncbi:MAG: hypothetical protein HC824_19615 [Synechococcales cyanobacterium RM1_1_8]|nr:hypothetical protein [Synechococcales cyanobacterium RM1_1_8]